MEENGRTMATKQGASEGDEWWVWGIGPRGAYRLPRWSATASNQGADIDSGPPRSTSKLPKKIGILGK